MPTTLFFDGRLTAIPGVEVKVDASALEQVGLGASGVVGIIGTAVGGRPATSSMTVDQLVRLQNPSAARDTFRSGDLREAASLAFEPSTDPRIPGGAVEVIAMKVNQATRSSATLSNGIGGALVVTSEDWGSFTEQINVTVANGTDAGRLVTAVFEATTQAGDNIGLVDDSVTSRETAMFQLDYEPPAGAGGWETMIADLLPTGRIVCYGSREDEGQSDEVTAVAPVGVPSIFEVVSSAAGDTTQTVTIYGLDAANAVLVETHALNGVTASTTGALIFSKVLGAVLSAVAVGTVTVRVDAVGATALTFAPGTTARGVTQPTAMFVGASTALVTTNSTTPNRNSAATADIILVGLSAAGAAQRERIQVNGTTNVRGTATWSRIDLIALGEIDQIGGDDVTIYAIAAQTTLAHNTLVKVRDYFNARQVDNVTPLAQEYGFTFTMLTSQTGADPATLDWTSTTTNIYDQGTHAGFSAVLQALVDYFNVSTDLVDAARVAFVAKVYTLTITAAGDATSGTHAVTIDGTTVTFTNGLAPTIALAQAGVVLLINNHPTLSRYVVAAAGTGAGVLTITGLTARTSPGFVASYVGTNNAAATLVLTTAQVGSGQAPDNGGPTFLTGGSEGTASFSDWQAAIDRLRIIDVNTIVPLTGDPAVHAYVEAHCAYMGGAGKSERDSIVGLSALDSSNDPTNVLPAKASIKTQVLSLNSRHVRACAQSITKPNTAGVSTVFLPWFQAVGAAGMQAGSPVGTSLTRKTMKIDALTQASDWDPVEDAHEMIMAGLWFMEAHRTGRRVVRNITTYLQSNNLAFSEASVNEAVNFTVFNFRDAMETVVGEPGFAGTLAAGKSAASTKLNLLLREGAVVQWRALLLTLAADVMDVSVEIAPVIPVNFVRANVHLVTLAQAA